MLCISPLKKGENNGLYIGDEKIGDSELENQEVIVGIRPEGFVLDENGPFVAKLNNVEVMGRDVSIVSSHEASLNPIIRSIVDADYKIDATSTTIKYYLKPHKVFLFNAETEERIYFEV